MVHFPADYSHELYGSLLKNTSIKNMFMNSQHLFHQAITMKFIESKTN